MENEFHLPHRKGPSPETTARLPHSQLSQHGPDEIIEKLHRFCFALPNVKNEASLISVPGSRALVLTEGCRCHEGAFMVGREFAHIHPKPDNGSMHLMLEAEDAATVVEKGWGEDHYFVTQGQFPYGLLLVFSPRNDEELEVILLIVKRSYEYACEARG
ncbi:MAG: hypothetical protein AAF733_00205 [Verrucomicrobiota bacterium]